LIEKYSPTKKVPKSPFKELTHIERIVPLSTIWHPSAMVQICETYLYFKRKSRGQKKPGLGGQCRVMGGKGKVAQDSWGWVILLPKEYSFIYHITYYIINISQVLNLRGSK
jgi:hypothetical protein